MTQVSHRPPSPTTTRRRLPRGRRGSAVLQTAFVVNVLLIVLFGVIEFGQFLYVRHAFQAAARDAARQAGLASATQAGLTATAAAALLQANVTLNASWLTVYDVPAAGGTGTAVSDVSTIPSGDKVEVVISTTYDQVPNACRPLYQLFGKGIGSGKAVAGDATAMRE